MMYHHYLCRLKQDVYDTIGDEPAAATVKKEGEEGGA